MKINQELLAACLDAMLRLLPQEIILKIKAISHHQAKLRTLAGWLTLHELFCSQGIELKHQEITFSLTGKPFVKGLPFSFNISHSKDIAISAIASNCDVGIDIQHKRRIKWQGFEKYFSLSQWQDIITSANSTDRFYHYWSLKESVLKAEGSGLAGNLALIDIADDRAYFKGKVWYHTEINIDPQYACFVTACRQMQVVSRQLHANKLQT